MILLAIAMLVSTPQLVQQMRHEEALCSPSLRGRAYYADRHCSAFDKLSDRLEARGLCMMYDRLFIDCDLARPYAEQRRRRH
jgi:hypothetical protein